LTKRQRGAIIELLSKLIDIIKIVDIVYRGAGIPIARTRRESRVKNK